MNDTTFLLKKSYENKSVFLTSEFRVICLWSNGKVNTVKFYSYSEAKSFYDGFTEED